MEIKYFGHSSFLCKGKTTTVITDPYDPEMIGLKFPKHITSDIVTVSHDHPDHNAVHLVEGQPFVIHGPGEYEIKGVSIIGMKTYHDEVKGANRGANTVYRIEMDNLVIVHLGDLGVMLDTKEIDDLDGVDILMIPVGGEYTIKVHDVQAIISEIEPSILIPMHFNRPDLNSKTFGKLTDLSAFLKESGKEDVQPVSKLSITKDKLPQEMQIVLFE